MVPNEDIEAAIPLLMADARAADTLDKLWNGYRDRLGSFTHWQGFYDDVAENGDAEIKDDGLDYLVSFLVLYANWPTPQSGIDSEYYTGFRQMISGYFPGDDQVPCYVAEVWKWQGYEDYESWYALVDSAENENGEGRYRYQYSPDAVPDASPGQEWKTWEQAFGAPPEAPAAGGPAGAVQGPGLFDGGAEEEPGGPQAARSDGGARPAPGPPAAPGGALGGSGAQPGRTSSSAGSALADDFVRRVRDRIEESSDEKLDEEDLAVLIEYARKVAKAKAAASAG